jgi:hypothetical protein
MGYESDKDIVGQLLRKMPTSVKVVSIVVLVVVMAILAVEIVTALRVCASHHYLFFSE